MKDWTITFTVTEQHIKLLRRACIRWEDCEFGAPAIDCKRPYGNSDVYHDIAEVLGLDEDAIEEAELRELHEQTTTALQIFLTTGEMRPGTYVADRYKQDWRLV